MGDPNIVAGLPVAQCATRPGSLPDVRARLSELRRTRPPTMTIALDDIDGADEAISVLAEIEAAKAWLDRLSVTAAGALLSWSEDRTRADLNHYGATATERAQTMTHARTSIIDEICLATGLARGDATARAETGVLARREPDRTTSALAALTTGQIGWWRARTIITGCTPLPADQANDVASAVLRPTRDGTTPSPRLIADRLAKELKKRIPGRVRRAEALGRRDTSVRLGDDDTATLGIGGSTERVTAAHDRLDRLARRLRHAGDPRTLAQLRADIGLDLLLHGHSPALCDTTDPAPRRTAPCTPPAPDHASHTTGDTTGDTTQPSCDHSGFTAVAQDAGPAFGFFFYIAQTTLAAPVDTLNFEIIEEQGGATEAGSYPLTGENYKTCGNCVLVYQGCDENLDNCAKTYLAQSGTLVIDDLGDVSGTFAGTLQNAVLAEVTVAEDYTSTLVTGGETWCIDSFAFSADVQ